MSHLLHPELFDRVPVTGGLLARRLEEFSVAAAHDELYSAPVSVVVRTLNEEPQLRALWHDIAAQKFADNIELVVVDNSSKDGTLEFASSQGATTRTVERDEFTYPKALNLGIEAAKHEVVLLTSAHNLFSNDTAMAKGVDHVVRGAAGAYAFPPLANANASISERLGIAMIDPFLVRAAHTLKRAGWGALCAASAIISRQAWDEAGRFDESYEAGGEDTALARAFLRRNEYIVHEPLLSMHHTHGMSTVNRFRRSIKTYQNLRRAQTIDLAALRRSRPDLHVD